MPLVKIISKFIVLEAAGNNNKAMQIVDHFGFRELSTLVAL